MAKKHYLSKEDSLQILKNALIPEIKNAGTLDFLVLSVSSAIHDLVPIESEETLFKNVVENAITFWKTDSEEQSFEKLKTILIGLFVRKTSNKSLEFFNKNTGLLLAISLVISAFGLVLSALNIIFC